MRIKSERIKFPGQNNYFLWLIIIGNAPVNDVYQLVDFASLINRQNLQWIMITLKITNGPCDQLSAERWDENEIQNHSAPFESLHWMESSAPALLLNSCLHAPNLPSVGVRVIVSSLFILKTRQFNSFVRKFLGGRCDACDLANCETIALSSYNWRKRCLDHVSCICLISRE